jgi:hypothetical protein
LEDTIFWYKAEMRGEFKLGAPEFWQHSANIFRDKDEEYINSYDPNMNKKLKMPITVRKV